MRHVALWAVVVCMLASAGAARDTASAIEVDRKPPTVERRIFDPGDPPGEMPELMPGEAAVTKASFSIATEIKATVVSESGKAGRYTSTVKLASAHLTTGLRIIVWLPEGPPPVLVAHEEGHREIGEFFYRNAAAVARAVAQRYVGQTFTAEGKTAEAARKAAIGKATSALGLAYMESTEKAAARVNAAYDQMTDHGLSQDISSGEGVKLAIQEFEENGRQRRR